MGRQRKRLPKADGLHFAAPASWHGCSRRGIRSWVTKKRGRCGYSAQDDLLDSIYIWDDDERKYGSKLSTDVEIILMGKSNWSIRMRSSRHWWLKSFRSSTNQRSFSLLKQLKEALFWQIRATGANLQKMTILTCSKPAKRTKFQLSRLGGLQSRVL